MDVKTILDSYGIKIRSETNNNYTCHCPLHSDRNCSFSIHRSQGIWICFAGCGKGNLISLISRLQKISYEDASEIFYSKFGYEKIINSAIKEKIIKNSSAKIHIESLISLPKEFISFRDTIFSKHPLYFSYIQSRISKQTIEKFNIGFCDRGKYYKRIIIPITYNHSNVGFIARAIDSKMKRYLNPTGFKASKYLFNIDSIKDSSEDLYICESVFDALTLDSWGYDVVATFGAKISLAQIDALSKFANRPIKFVFHNDKAGIYGMYSQISTLRTVFPKLFWIKLPHDMDVNSITQQEFLCCTTISLAENNKKLNIIKDRISKKKGELCQN